MIVSRTKKTKPRRTMIYGVHGIGKSTFAAMSDDPVFIQTEDGLADIETNAYPLCVSYDDVLACIADIFRNQQNYKTVCIDSLDWLETLIWRKVCADKSVTSIEDIGYAKGYTFALGYWQTIIDGLNALRDEKNMSVMLVAHAKIESFAHPDPNVQTYDRFTPRLHKLSGAKIMEWCDEVFFATYKLYTKMVGEGFEKRLMPVGGDDRIIKTTEKPSHVAKNRLNMPDEIPLDYRIYRQYLTGTLPEVSTNNAGA